MEFLSSKGDIVLIFHWSKNRRLNLLNKFPKKGVGNFFFLIWNKKFKFKPNFVEIKPEYRKGKYKFGLINSGVPVIEFSRASEKYPGRLYWEKYFTNQNLDYDVEEFEKWYDVIVKWIKKNCKYNHGVYKG